MGRKPASYVSGMKAHPSTLHQPALETVPVHQLGLAVCNRYQCRLFILFYH